jgi:uncharacterized ferritin-like protein (DUF455 family)
MRQILEDEIQHVSFGIQWLKKMKAPEDSTWESWRKHSHPNLPPKRAQGTPFQEEHRKKAHIPPDWIPLLLNS